MIQKIKKHLMVSAVGIMMVFPLAVGTGMASADSTSAGAGANVSNGLCSGINASSGTSTNGGDCGTTSGNGEGTLESIASTIVNIFSVIVGVAAVVMIIFGGFRYITSGGDSGRVGNAKNTLIYAIIGLIIVALAQAIVHFVLDNAAAANNPSSGYQSASYVRLVK
jgi:uncharacterized membrane protein